MNKLVISLAVISALGLSACDSETIKDVQTEVPQDGTVLSASARVVFDPSNGVLSVPNDLLFQGSTDGTLNIPVADPSDFSDPTNALNILDGWSTQNPFVLSLDFPEGTSLDGNSVFNPAAVRIFEAKMGGDLTDSDCTSVPRGLACKIVGELTFGLDFIAQKSGNDIAVVPLKPLKSATSYILALTNHISDDTGRSVDGSSSYELVRQDLATLPLGSEAQLGLQAIVNSFETAVVGAGVDKDSIIYTMAMTTQSIGVVLGTAKKLLATGVDPDPAKVVIPLPVIAVNDTGMTVSQALIAGGVLDETNPAHADLLVLHTAAKLSSGTITLPYYLSMPTAENPAAPINTWWKARCDSGATLAGLAAVNPAAIPAEPMSPNDGFCMAFGLRDLGIDTERHLTKYNPIPAVTTTNTLDVQMTVPDLAFVNSIRASQGLDAIEKPENGWPIVMLAHGIPSQKEHMLLVTGSLALQGLATIAIDHPLHNSRGFGPMNAAVNPLTYMNLASLPTLRDNLRQSVADLLGLRWGINFLMGADGSDTGIDKTRVHYLGQSLGSITGTDFLALTNTPIAGAPEMINAMFKVQASTLAVPTEGLAHALLASDSFGTLLKSNLTMAGSDDFAAYVNGKAAAANINNAHADWNALTVQSFIEFWSTISVEEQAELTGVFVQFAFAAQTMLDAGDPTNYALMLAANNTPLHVIEVVGGLELTGDFENIVNGSDAVLPNAAPSMPLSGTDTLIALLGLSDVSQTLYDEVNPVSGVVRFIGGDHSSMFSPSPTQASPDPVVSARAFQEMQMQTATYLSTNGHLLPIVDSGLILGGN